MDRANYFRSLDRKTSIADSLVEAKAVDYERRQEIVRRIVDTAKPMLEEYKNELERRGIGVTLTAQGTTLSFVMRYRNDDRCGFELRSELGKGPKEIRFRFDRLIGRGYGVGGGPPTDESWNLATFEEYVQGIIDRGFEGADRSGGFEPPIQRDG